ncbi:MAG TPA: glycosyltransferase family 1 protein [Cytophagaceae bacterium]
MVRKKIAFISEHASPLAMLGGVDSGGQNLYVDRVAKHLYQLGYEVDIYTRWDNRDYQQVINYAEGVRVIHVSAGPRVYIPKEEIFQYMDEFAANMIHYIKSSGIQYEILHAHFWMSGYAAVVIKNILKVPFVITFHALGKLRKIYHGVNDSFPDVRSSIEEMIIREADSVIAECPQDKEDLMVHYRADEEKINIIPCGFDKTEFYPISKKKARSILGLNTSEFIILQLGRMVPRKGIDNVVRSISYLKDKLRSQVRLVIVGGESDDPDPNLTPEIGRLQSIANELNVIDRIVFVGRKKREELKYYYNASDVFVSTPWYEPFGITPVEAMACGIPVIGSNVGGIKFSVRHNKTGFLVPPNEPELLAQRLEELIINKDKFKLFSQKAVEHVNTFFTWDTVSRNIAKLYEVVKEKHRRSENKQQVSVLGMLSTLRKKLISVTMKRVSEVKDYEYSKG